MILITPSIAIDETALSEAFIRASGPGGQNVNKVATAVELKLDLGKSGLPGELIARLKAQAASRISADNVLRVVSQKTRSQERNRADAMEKLAALIRAAAVRPKKRIATRVSYTQKAKRREVKSRRSQVKKLRSVRSIDD
jgi:ribosome-associated protein